MFLLNQTINTCIDSSLHLDRMKALNFGLIFRICRGRLSTALLFLGESRKWALSLDKPEIPSLNPKTERSLFFADYCQIQTF